MKTIADLKRAIQKGVKLHCIFHQESAGRDEKGMLMLTDKDRGTREVNIVQSNSFTLLTEQKDKEGNLTGVFVDSWLNWPKAKEFKPIDNNTFMILSEDFRRGSPTEGQLIPLCTYKIV